MKIVIIGLGAAGFNAALAARKQDRNAEIVIIDKKSYDLTHPCGMPFYLEGKIKDFDNLKHDLSLDKMNIKKHDNSSITSIDTDNKEIVFNKTEKISYDKLIIATGASPVFPPIKNIEKAYKAHDINDVKKLKDNLKNIKKAIIIGAGAIGLETAVALKNNNIKVSVADIKDHALPTLIDKDIAEILEGYLKKQGIELEFKKKIEKIEDDNVILAAGVKPNIEFLSGNKVKIGKGIIVNDRMETNVKDVYAAGDCTQQISLINKKPFNAQLATTASKQGAIAGVNAANGKASYKGVLGTFVSKIGEMEIAATGFNSHFAEQNGYKIITAKAKSKTKPEWFPGGGEITAKLIADEKGKILGAQIIGKEVVSGINVVSAAIKAGFTLKDLAEIELAYCPVVSDVKDVLIIAAELGLRKVK